MRRITLQTVGKSVTFIHETILNTSHNGILLTFVKRTDFDVAGKFEKLLNDGIIVQTMSDALTYDTLHSTEDNLWSVLLMTGYITKAVPDEDGDIVSLKIPNKEIASIFQEKGKSSQSIRGKD